MRHLLEDPCALFFASLVMFAVGEAATKDEDKYRRIGAASGGAALILLIFVGGVCEGYDTAGMAVISVSLGLLTVGSARIILQAVAFAYEHSVGRLITSMRSAAAQREQAARDRQQKREDEARERREQARREREAPALERARRQAEEAAEAAEREKNQKTQDARDEVVRFYDEHPEIHEALPPALFKSQMQTRFPEGIEPATAWKAAEEMVSGMLPQVAQGRERQRAKQQEQKERADRMQKIREEIDELENEMKLLTGTKLDDPSIIEDEFLAIKERIHQLSEEQKALEAAG